MFNKKLTSDERTKKLLEHNYNSQVTKTIVMFLNNIGIKVMFGKVRGKTILPGIKIIDGVITFDEKKLTYPGDLLHEAGHLAVMPKERREQCGENVGNNGGEEMGAIAWSYAAALHLNLNPEIVFHSGGYKNGSDSILENFKKGKFFGVPILQWAELTAEGKLAEELGIEPFPKMIKWLRD